MVAAAVQKSIDCQFPSLLAKTINIKIMSSSSSSTLAPTTEQILFAKAIILTFNLWPALRLAVSEEWGGPESKDKKQFLIEHLADTYAGKIGYSNSTLSSLPQPIKPSDWPQSPDQDDLAELLENYFQDEFEARLDDDSADYVARRILDLWKLIFIKKENAGEGDGDELREAREAIQRLEKAEMELRGSKSKVQKGPEEEELQGNDDEQDEGEDDDEEMTDGTNANANQNNRRQRQEPQVDEDGFTTVVSNRRR